MVNLEKLPNENEEQYIWRIGQYKDNGVIDIGWDELGYVFNTELRGGEEEQTSSSYRKPYQNAKRFYENVFVDMINNNATSENIQQQLDDIYRAKKQLYDQRREYRKNLVPEARGIHLSEHLIECAKQLNKERPLEFKKNRYEFSTREAVLVLSDWHYGMVTNNIWNKYNVSICKERVQELTSRTLEYIDLHKPSKLHILILGDMANGAIHNSVRVASEEDTSDQLMHVSEIIAQMVETLSSEVGKTLIYSTYGNHMRTVQNAKDSIHTDNMEKLIPWWLKARLLKDDRKDIEIVESDFKEFISLNVCGSEVIATHGDLDKIKNFGTMVNTIFSKMYNKTIDCCILGDKHHLEEFESFGIETMISRSLCGSDNYANNHRLYSSSGQTLIFFSPDYGKECTYNIRFS